MKKYTFHLEKLCIIIIGTFTAAAAISLFLAPNKLTGGGITGISTIIHYIWGFPIGVVSLLLNIPLFALGVWSEGKYFFIKSLYSTFLLSFFIDMLAGLGPLTEDLFLASVFGGMLMGTGLGLVFIAMATTGGTDIIAKLVQRVIRHISIGRILLSVDILIILLAAITFADKKTGMYSAVSLYTSSHVIDAIIDGGKFAKTVIIISDKYYEIAQGIKHDLKRGVTGLAGKGMYSGQDKTVLMCTVKRRELPRLKDLVREKEDREFVILTDVREIFGEGFLMD